MKEEDIIDNQWYEFKYPDRSSWYCIGSEYKKFLEVCKELEELEYKLIFGDKYEEDKDTK